MKSKKPPLWRFFTLTKDIISGLLTADGTTRHCPHVVAPDDVKIHEIDMNVKSDFCIQNTSYNLNLYPFGDSILEVVLKYFSVFPCYSFMNF